MTFDSSIKRILSNEGNFSKDENDPGNWTGGKIGAGELRGTKYGISAKSYPGLDIANLSLAVCCELYKRDFWNVIGGDKFPDSIGYQLLDCAVNSGSSTAIRMLQRSVGVADDGIVGPHTLEAIKKTEPHDLIMVFLGNRLEYMTNCKNWPNAGKGWARRIAANLRYGAQDV